MCPGFLLSGILEVGVMEGHSGVYLLLISSSRERLKLVAEPEKTGGMLGVT